MIHTLAEVPGSRALLQHNGTQQDASELYEGGSLADVVAAASAAAPHQVTSIYCDDCPLTRHACLIVCQCTDAWGMILHVCCAQRCCSDM